MSEKNSVEQEGSIDGKNNEKEKADIEQVLFANKELSENFDELSDKFLRLQADFDNYRRRSGIEKKQIAAAAGEKLLIEIIDIFENFERFLAADCKDTKTMRCGIEMIHKKFSDLLRREGVEKIPAVGEKFNPGLHHVIASVESLEKEDGEIVEELKSGYLKDGRVLKPAFVCVARCMKDKDNEDD